jgi:hypothetical protein
MRSQPTTAMAASMTAWLSQGAYSDPVRANSHAQIAPPSAIQSDNGIVNIQNCPGR